jgi:branched-subunit amino acid ABC-type transport system permease component
MFIAEVALIMLFGVDFRYVHAPYITTTWNFGDIALPLRLAVPFAGSVLMLAALELFLRKTFIGRAIVPVAQDPFALRLVAVSPVRIKRIAFGIACASAALAGAFIIVIEPLQPAVGREFIGRVFAICVFGGLVIVSLNALRGVEAGYVSARNHRTAGFGCEPKALPAERASAAERSPRYKPRPTMLVRRASRLEAWWCSIYHRHRCSGPHWPENWKQERPHKQRRSVIACFRT